jgi:hypothetical protein
MLRHRDSARWALLFAALSLCVASACSSSKNPSSTSAGADDSEAGYGNEVVSCQGDPRVSASSLPFTLTGAQGLQVTLDTRSPDPAGRGLNQWTIAVADHAGAPLVGAKVVVLPTMPDHGHKSPAPLPPATDSAGMSTASGIDFFMAGVWRVEIDVYTAASASAPTDSVAFWYCIEG